MLNNFMNNANVLLNKANDNTKITAQAMQTVSVSALKYANDKFNNAPVLMPLENFNINNLSFDNEQDREQLIETLIYNAKQKSLDKLLGDHIVKCYKKDNPEEQSFHTTDCSRLNYIVCNLIENALTWAVDKSGIKICSSIVKPLIEKCINLLLEYQKTLINKMAEGDYKDKDTVHTILNLLMTIDKGSLESDINKYIAPFFNLNKN
jgi:K+-sensing histidine kinase KdpD